MAEPDTYISWCSFCEKCDYDNSICGLECKHRLCARCLEELTLRKPDDTAIICPLCHSGTLDTDGEQVPVKDTDGTNVKEKERKVGVGGTKETGNKFDECKSGNAQAKDKQTKDGTKEKDVHKKKGTQGEKGYSEEENESRKCEKNLKEGPQQQKGRKNTLGAGKDDDDLPGAFAAQCTTIEGHKDTSCFDCDKIASSECRHCEICLCSDCGKDHTRSHGHQLMSLFSAPGLYTAILHTEIEVQTAYDVYKPDPDDVAVVVVNGSEVLVVTDYLNESVKAFHTEKGKQRCHTLPLNYRPHSISAFDDNKLALSYWTEACITIIAVKPELVILRNFRPYYDYKCLTTMARGKIAVASPPYMEILDANGTTKRSNDLSYEVNMKCPRGMTTTQDGLILVSDAGSQAVYCLTPDGHLVFTYSPDGAKSLQWPRGVAVTNTGAILVADNHNSTVTQLSQEGEYVGDIITGNDVTSPHGLCVHGDKLYVTEVEGNVKVFQLMET